MKNHDKNFRAWIDQDATSGALAEQFLAGAGQPCFIALSPTTSFVNRARLSVLLAWAASQTSDVLIVEGSLLHRWNLVAMEGISEDDALARLLIHVPRFVRRVRELSRDISGSTVTVLDWLKLVRSEPYRKIHEAVEEFDRNNPDFATAVTLPSAAYFNRVSTTQRFTDLSHERQRALREYVIEEVCVFIWLYQTGRPVEVYPGDDIPIMREIVNGRFGGFPFSCPSRTHIALKVESE